MAKEPNEPLTVREQSVLDLLRRGLTNAQIASELDITEYTAKDHVSGILRKLGVRNRHEAAYWPESAPWWARVPLVTPIVLFLRRRSGRPGVSLTAAAASLLTVAAVVAVVFAVLVFLTRADDEEQPTGRWLSLLALVPDNEASRAEVTMNDYAMLRDVYGIERPSVDANEDELIDYYVEILGATENIWPAEMLGEVRQRDVFTALRTELGFTIADVDIDLLAGNVRTLSPPGIRPEYQLVRGRFTEEQIEEALPTDPTFGDVLERAAYNGTFYYHWGYEGANVQRTTLIRPLGEGAQILIDDNTLFWTYEYDRMKEMIDASRNDEASLADAEDYQRVAAALDDLGTFGVSLQWQPQSLWVEGEAGVNEGDLALDHLLAPYNLVGTGRGLDVDGSFLAIVLAHDDERVADENVSRLETRIEQAGQLNSQERFAGNASPRWADHIDASEIYADGRLLIAKLYDQDEELPHFVWIPADTLLIHE